VLATIDVTLTVRRAFARSRVTFPIDAARRHLLATVARLAPNVLTELAMVDDPTSLKVEIDDTALIAWAERTGIDAPWLRIVARSTIRLWRALPAARGSTWDDNLVNKGFLIPERGRLPQRPPEILIRPEHFEWLVRRRVLRQPYRAITTPEQTAHRAVTALARRLGLDGPTKKSRKPKSRNHQ